MISMRFAIYYLCVAILSKTEGITAPTEDLVDEYYPNTLKPNSDTKDENIVLSQYLRGFLNDRNEIMITIGMVLTKDMEAMIATYDSSHPKFSFKEQRKSQRPPYENMLRVWVRHNRDAIEKDEPNHDDVVNDANALKKEHDSGHWHKKCRDQLELILMKKSIVYSRAVIAEFETIMGNKTIESIIIDSKQTSKLNEDLAYAYSSLDKYNYIADTLSKHSEPSDPWGVWFMCIAVLRHQEWPKVDLAFRNLKDHKDESLSQFIMQKRTDDKEMAEKIAAIVDLQIKKTFAENLVSGQGGPEATTTTISSTTQAPVPFPAPSPASPH